MVKPPGSEIDNCNFVIGRLGLVTLDKLDFSHWTNLVTFLAACVALTGPVL